VAGQPVGPWQRPDGAAFERLQFLGAFLRNPAGVGALMPSSPALARELVDSCDLGAARVVVELGPGTGAVTEVLLQHLGKRSRFFALEVDRNNTFLLRLRDSQ
jgi:phospholipid N-methyltransferase